MSRNNPAPFNLAGMPTPPPGYPTGTAPDGSKLIDTVNPAGPQNLTQLGRGEPGSIAAQPDPVATMRGATTTSVQTVDKADEYREAGDPVRDFDEEHRQIDRARERHKQLAKTGYTPLDSHPPLKRGDRIQGPHDRKNRDPLPAEIEHGEMMSATVDLNAMIGQHKPNDPPIDENAPKDIPADPRKVAESRGLKFEPIRPEGQPGVDIGRPVSEHVPPEERPFDLNTP